MPGTLYAGTSGYSYKEWRGAFFPEDLAPEQFLRHYSGRLPSVEINNTFYRFPTESVLDQWAAETPPGFLFAVKANQRITHRSRLKNVEQTTRDFVERCRLLADRLGPLLFQLPPQLARDDGRLDGFLASLPAGGRYAVEFRHPSWFDDEVLERLARADVALVQSEDDKLSAPRTATASFCYARLRRSEYRPEDLDRWRDWIEEQRAAGRDVFAYLKHDESGASPAAAIARLRGE